MTISTPTVRDERDTMSQEQRDTTPAENGSQAVSPAEDEAVAEEAQSDETEEALQPFLQDMIEVLRERNIGLTTDVVTYLGVKRSKEFLAQTLKIEERGGMSVHSGQRRRTPGGVFFYLVKQNIDFEVLKELFPYIPQKLLTPEEMREQRRTHRSGKKALLRQQVKDAWENRIEPIKELLKSKQIGKSNNMRVTLIGRPGKLRAQRGFVMTAMRAPERAPSLPKELPAPPESKLVYLVCIGQRQWRKVERAIRNPEDVLIIEGYLTYEKKLKKMAVFAQMVTTKFIQQKLRETQKAKAEQEKAAQR